MLRQAGPSAPQERTLDRREWARLSELVGRVRHQTGAEQHEDDGRYAEERPQVDASTECVDEKADSRRNRETDDRTEDLALARCREHEERQLDAVAYDGEEDEKEHAPGGAAAFEDGLDSALKLRTQEARIAEHPEHHPGQEDRREQHRCALEQLLRRALEL